MSVFGDDDSDIKSNSAIKSLNDIKLFFNKPAKDIFYNLGGIRTILPLLTSQLLFKNNSTENEYLL